MAKKTVIPDEFFYFLFHFSENIVHLFIFQKNYYPKLVAFSKMNFYVLANSGYKEFILNYNWCNRKALQYYACKIDECWC